jgi:hypothetical protein
MTGDFSVSCPKDSYINEISGRADAVSLQGLRLSCTDGSLLFAFDTGVGGGFVTNTHPNGYNLIDFSTTAEGFASLWPYYYYAQWGGNPQLQIGDLFRSGTTYSDFSCARGLKFTGISGHIDINDKQYPIKSIKIYCKCTFITKYLIILSVLKYTFLDNRREFACSYSISYCAADFDPDI